MGRDRSATLIARLRAHRKLPAGVPVRVQPVTRAPGSAQTAWKILHAVTGEPVGVESKHSITAMLAAREWAFRLDGGVTIAEPAAPDPSRLGAGTTKTETATEGTVR